MQKCSTSKCSGISSQFIKSNSKSRNFFGTLLRLFSMILKTSKVALSLQVLFSIIGGILPVLVAIQWKTILSFLDNSLNHFKIHELILSFIVLGIVGSLSSSFSYFTEIVDTYFRNELSLNMQTYIHKKAEKLPILYFELPQLKDVMDRAQEAFCYGPAIGLALNTTLLLSSIISMISASILLINFHPLLICIMIFTSIPYLLKLYINNKKIEFEIKVSPKRREASEYIKYITKYEYIKETQLWQIGNFFLNKWLTLMNKINKYEIISNKKLLFLEFFIDFINILGYILSIALSSYLTYNNILNIGEFGAIIFLLGDVKEKIEMFLQVITDLHDELINVENGFDYLDLIEEKREKLISPTIKNEVLSENVSFSYPLTNKNVINNLNFKIEKNEIIAIVGLNGAGKSTIAKLLLGLLRPTSGCIKYDNMDISKIDYKFLYKNLSAMFQDFNHYYLNIKDNITLSDIDNMDNMELLIASCIKSGILKDINILPDGLNTILGKQFGGKELSGGQWQQLALTRAYFRNSQLIVLDEPTSALDSFNEEVLYKNFQNLCKNKIGIIITHRLSAASLADRILLIEDGNIIEEGSHDKLISLKGKYWFMYNQQSAIYKPIDK